MPIDPRMQIEHERILMMLRQAQQFIREAHESLAKSMNEIGKETDNAMMTHRWAAVTFTKAALAILELQ